MIPPIQNIGNTLVLYREPESDVVVLILENQDSYESATEEIEAYLKLLGVEEGLGILDYCWNFGDRKSVV